MATEIPYFGGNVGQSIAQALYERDALNRQKDLDAVQTGVGATPITPYDTSAPQSHGFLDTVRGAWDHVRGNPGPNAAAQGNALVTGMNNMSRDAATQNSAAMANRMTGTPPAPASSMVAPGAFNPMTGGFNPATSAMSQVPQQFRVPSGQVVDTAMTPFGHEMTRMASLQDFQAKVRAAMIENQQYLQGVKGDQRLQQIGLQGTNQETVANTRGGYQIGSAVIHAGQSNTNNVRSNNTRLTIHDTPSAGGGAAGSPISGLTHAAVPVQNQIRETNSELASDQKVVSAGLSRHASPADSANYNAAAAAIPRLKTTRDSLKTVYGGIAARMQGGTTPPGPTPAGSPAVAKTPINQAEYQQLKAGFTKNGKTYAPMSDDAIRQSYTVQP